MNRLLLACVAVFACAAVIEASCGRSQCTSSRNGQKWWSGNIQQQCKYDSRKRRGTIINIGCRTPTKRAFLKPGGDARDGDYHYECNGDANSLALEVEHCYMPDGEALLVGEKADDGGYTYSCDKSGCGGRRGSKKYVKRTKTAKNDAAKYKGKSFKCGQYYNDEATNTRLKCQKDGKTGKLTMVAVGCCKNGKIGSWGSFFSGGSCQKDTRNPQGCSFRKQSLSCKDNKGKTRQVGEKWEEDGKIKRCEYSNENDFKRGKDKELKCRSATFGCIKKVGSSWVKVDRNCAKRVGSKTYKCEGVGKNSDGTTKYQFKEIESNRGQCDIMGKKVDINKDTVINNVKYKCFYKCGDGKPTHYASECVDNDGKSVWKNKNRDFGSYGKVCEQKNGKVTYRKMSDAEYKKWKGGCGRTCRGNDDAGDGAEGVDPKTGGCTKCRDGYKKVWSGWKFVCKDINECLKGGHDCDDSTERCENTEGKWKCLCKAGTVRDDATGKCVEEDCPCMGKEIFGQRG